MSEAVICEASEWGVEAADVLLSDANMLDVLSWKSFSSNISATNLDVQEVNMSKLLSKSSDQVFHGNQIIVLSYFG